MRKNQCKKTENSKTQRSPSLPNDCSNSPGRAQNWAEAEMLELTEVGFVEWLKINFSELQEHVVTQCKEAKIHDRTIQKLITRIASLEKNINDLMELKNTARELCKAYTSFNSQINQAAERISEIEDQLNEIK